MILICRKDYTCWNRLVFHCLVSIVGLLFIAVVVVVVVMAMSCNTLAHEITQNKI